MKLNSWKVFALTMCLGFPIGFIHIVQLQKARMADDLGLWYRFYCAVAYVGPYVVGLTLIHLLFGYLGKNKQQWECQTQAV